MKHDETQVSGLPSTRVVDCFLFFQELDLLEIRLRYLNEAVDKFVVVEACQTFTGASKGFVFEENIERYRSYLGKIAYLKIEDAHDSYESVIGHLTRREDKGVHSKIKQRMEEHQHYDKAKLYYVLDTYHRECINIALAELDIQDTDLVMISDLDEIPSLGAISRARIAGITEKPLVLKQKEFSYYLDYYKNADWLGTNIGAYGLIKGLSLNSLRIDSKSRRCLIEKAPVENGGYHFTTCGSIDMIKRKIASWAHQEFNNSYVTDRLETNIRTGQDLFMRNVGTVFARVRLSDREVYDEKMGLILKDYPELLSQKEIEYVQSSLALLTIRKLRLNLRRLWRKSKTLTSQIRSAITR